MAKKYNVAAMAASVMAKPKKSMPMNEEAGETTPDNEMAEMAPKKTMKRQHPSSGKYKPSALAAAAKPNAKAPLGQGGRFAALKSKLADRPGVTDPGALAAFIGRKKYGNAKFNSLSKGGK